MSRIDKALRTWEAASADVVDATVAEHQVEYPREISPEAPAAAEQASAVSVEQHAQWPHAEERRPGRQATRLHDSGDLRARLLTGVSSRVPIEQYRRLAAVLHEEQVKGNLKTVMITSALPGEGKTLTATNLALTLSGSYGRRVVVIDADLRAPALHKLLEIRNGRGLSEALRERDAPLPVVEVSSGLCALTAGHPGPTPLADLTSDRMEDIVQQCAAHFDWVILDTSPVGLLPDAQLLARLVGAVIFVIAAGSTPADVVERAVGEIGTDAIIGTVLNRVDERRIPDVDYYSRYGY